MLGIPPLRVAIPVFLSLLSSWTPASGDDAKEELEEKKVSSFEKDLEKWEFNGGYEFKGGKGKLSFDAETGKDKPGSAKLEANFSKGGAYAAMVRKSSLNAKVLRLWVKAPGYRNLNFRLMDGSKQYFQYVVPLDGGDAWQQVSLSDFEKCKNSWGGANDKKWHPPVKEIWIMNDRGGMKEGSSEGTIWIDDVEVTKVKFIPVPPKPMPEGAALPPKESIFGFSGHMIHTHLFYGEERMGPYWQPEYTLPHIVGGGFACMREPLYQGFFVIDKKEDRDKPEIIELKKGRRELVERYLDMYGKSGVKVLLCPMFTKAGSEGFNEFFEWLASLPAKHPSVYGFEMHNEPHLKHFGNWNSKDYAEACLAASKILKAKNPSTPVMVGSLSHMWWGPAVKFLNGAIKLGVLDGADGISLHPYRMGIAPECGHSHCEKTDPKGLETEVQDFWTMVQEQNKSGKPLEMHFTEFGYSSGSGKGGLAPEQSEGLNSLEMQADYLSRELLVFTDLRLRGIPIHGLFWYDLKCDRDAEDLEANFGLISCDASTPRPAFLAYSQIAKQFGRLAEWESLSLPMSFSVNDNVRKTFAWRNLSDGSIVAAFWRLDQLQEKKEDFAAKLQISLPDGFMPSSVQSMKLGPDARREDVKYAVADGKLALDVNVSSRATLLFIKPAKEEGVKVVGQPPWLHTLPADFKLADGVSLKVSGAVRGSLGERPKLSFSAANAGAREVSGKIVCMGKSYPLSLGPGKESRVDVEPDVPAVNASGLLNYRIELDGMLAARGDCLMLFSDPLSLASPPSLGKDGRMSISIRNISDKIEAKLLSADWVSGEKSGSEKLDGAVKPGETRTLSIPFMPVEAFNAVDCSLKVNFEGRPPLSFKGKLSYSPCPKMTPAIDGDLKEWKGLPAIDLSKATVKIKDYKGVKDLSGLIWLGWDDRNLYVAAEIEDDKHSQTTGGEKGWQGDGIQMSVAELPDGKGVPEWNEFGICLAPSGPEVYRSIGPDGLKEGLVKDAKAQIRREGTSTIYEFAIPWTELAPASPSAGAILFSILVNENDGKKREGWIEWGAGIGNDKNPDKFRIVNLSSGGQ